MNKDRFLTVGRDVNPTGNPRPIEICISGLTETDRKPELGGFEHRIQLTPREASDLIAALGSALQSMLRDELNKKNS